MIPEKTASKPGEGDAPDDPAAFAAMIADLLGLPPETPAKALFAKLKEKMGAAPDPAKFVPVATVQAMLAERNLTLATASEERAGQKVAEALRLGHISPALKDWAIALCQSDEASLDRFLAGSTPHFAHIFKSTHTAGQPPQSPRATVQSDLAAAICSQLGLKPDALTE